MRRSVLFLLACVLITVACASCSLFKEKNTTTESVVSATDLDASPAPGWEVEPDTYSTYEQPTARTTSYDASEMVDEGVQTTGARYHTVVKKDTLYGLARMYYGDQRRWKDIFEANRSVISDPNKIRVGQRLLIP